MQTNIKVPANKINSSGATNPDFLHPATPNEFLPHISHWTTYGGLALLVIFGAAVSLASILKYQVTIKAPATIRPSGELRLVQAATEGTIKSIAVKANQQVKNGDVIALMDNSRWQTKKSELQTNIQQAIQQLAHFDAQIMAVDGQIAASGDRTNRTIAAATAELSRTQRDVQDRKITSGAQFREAEANLKQAQKELLRSQIKLKSATANFKSSEASLKAAKAKRDRYQPLAKNGSLSIDQFQETQLAVEQQEQLVESQNAVVQENRQAIEQQKQAIVAQEAKLRAAASALNPSDATVTVSIEKIAAENAAAKVSLARLNQERSQLLQQKLEIQKQLSRDRSELQQVNREIQTTVIRASASGIIHQLNLRNNSQVLRPGDIIAQIAPHDSPLEIKASVTPGDIRNIKTDQNVQMRVSGCPYTDYGILKGKVSAISPDAFTSQSNDTSATTARSATYEVTIQPQTLELSAQRHKCTIQSGMEGRADIISSQETLLQFLLRKARLLTDF